MKWLEALAAAGESLRGEARAAGAGIVQVALTFPDRGPMLAVVAFDESADLLREAIEALDDESPPDPTERERLLEEALRTLLRAYDMLFPCLKHGSVPDYELVCTTAPFKARKALDP